MRADALLVATSHGTSSPSGRAAIRGLVDAVRRRAPWLDVAEAFVDVQEPAVGDVVLTAGRPCVVVPLLLAPGYHVHVDVAEAVADDGHAASRTLAPDVRLAAILLERLAAAGAHADDAVVLAVAGSSDRRAHRVAELTASMLSVLWGSGVVVGHLGGTGRPLAEVLHEVRAGGRRVAVASFLMAPGFFHDRALGCGADVVTAPLLDGGPPDPRLVDLVVERYVEVAAGRLVSPVPAARAEM